MAQYIDKSAVIAEIENKIKEWKFGSSSEAKYRLEVYKELAEWLNAFETKGVDEEPVSNDLEQAANDYVGHAPEIDEDLSVYSNREAFKAGAQWQKKQMIDKACECLLYKQGFDPDIVEEFREEMKNN